MRHHSASSKFALGFAFAIAVQCVLANAGQPADIWIPAGAWDLKVKNVRLREGLTQTISFRGQVSVSGTVRYGWLEGGETALEMQFEPSNPSLRKLPRYIGCIEGICSDSFVLVNPNDIALALFGPAAISDLRARRVLALQVTTTLLLGDISFGSDCGVHYTASAAAVEGGNNGPVAVLEHGVPGHC